MSWRAVDCIDNADGQMLISWHNSKSSCCLYADILFSKVEWRKCHQIFFFLIFIIFSSFCTWSRTENVQDSACVCMSNFKSWDFPAFQCVVLPWYFLLLVCDRLSIFVLLTVLCYSHGSNFSKHQRKNIFLSFLFVSLAENSKLRHVEKDVLIPQIMRDRAKELCSDKVQGKS